MFFAVMKMRASSGEHQFPDIAMTCESVTNDDVIQEPCAVFEIIPSATGEVRNVSQLEEYLKISSLQRLVSLRQDRALVMVYAREVDGWRFSLLEEKGEFGLPCIGATVDVKDIHAGILPVAPQG